MLLIYHADIGGGAVWTMYSPTSKHTDIYSYTQISIATNRYLHPHWELHILRNVYRMSKPKNMLDQVHAATHTHTHTHTQSMFCFHFPILSIAIHIWWRRNGNPFQCSCLENVMDRGDWQASLCGVTKSQTQLSIYTHSHVSPPMLHSNPWPAGATLSASEPALQRLVFNPEPSCSHSWPLMTSTLKGQSWSLQSP